MLSYSFRLQGEYGSSADQLTPPGLTTETRPVDYSYENLTGGQGPPGRRRFVEAPI